MYYAAFFRKWLMGLEMHANMNATAPYICYYWGIEHADSHAFYARTKRLWRTLLGGIGRGVEGEDRGGV